MVTLENVSKRYGPRSALEPVSLAFERARTSVLIGPSGCGKSTVIRLIVGLVAPDSGVVRIGNEALTAENANRLRHAMGYVIQDGGLFPHLTAEDNVALLARHIGMEPHAVASRLRALADLVALPGEALTRFPQELSGGQRQRVGIMRALMLDPPLLLLDEPLGALDPVTRYELQGELKSIFDRLGKTVIMVTHDMGEAAYFAHRVIMLRGGRVIQSGRPEDLNERPADPYVTRFVRAQRVPAPEPR